MMAALCIALTALGPQLALGLGQSAPAPQGPVRYRADLLRSEPKEHKVTLDGDVHLARGDLVVTGAHAVAELASEKDASKPVPPEPGKGGKPGKPTKAAPAPPSVPGLGNFQRFTVDGQVHVERAGRTADADHALYDAASQTLTLTGPAAAREGLKASPVPVLRDGQEELAGDKIVLRLDRDDVDVVRPKLVLRRSQTAAGNGPESKGPPVPVRIDARTLVIDQDRRVLHFRDEVVLHRGDLLVVGPRLDARYDAGGDIEALTMTGGVLLRQGTRRASGKVATYSATTRRVALTGDPKLVDRGDELQGEKIELAVDTEEVWVEKARGRLHPDEHQGESVPAPKPQTPTPTQTQTQTQKKGDAK